MFKTLFKAILKGLQDPKNILLIVLFLAFLVGIININYNSPSPDEAVYVTVGYTEFFKGNWGLQDTSSWIGGHPYFYPTLTAIAYSIGGITASRIVNVVLSIICIYFVSKISRLFGSIGSQIITILIIGFLPASIYISRLATLDMPSFTFFAIGAYFLLSAIYKDLPKDKVARNFFVSAIFIALSFIFKYITILYIPFLALVWLKITDKDIKHMYLYYLVIPLGIITSIVIGTQFSFLLRYVSTQYGREKSNFTDIVNLVINTNFFYWFMAIAGSVILIIKRQWRMFLVALAFSIIPFLFHLSLLRFATLDKHIFLIFLPFAVTTGIAFASLPKKFVVYAAVFDILLFGICFGINSISKYNKIWPNYNGGISYLSQNLKTGDTLLTESGSNIVLVASDKISRNNIATFDWINFNGKIGEDGYTQALLETYFDYIELDKNNFAKINSYKDLNNLVSKNMDENYTETYSDSNVVIYKRAF